MQKNSGKRFRFDSDPRSGISIVEEEEIAGLYRIHEFAQLAGVTVKALHHYDRQRLLKPCRSDAGYRLYVEHDLARLEQIVAHKFLGLPLKQIKILLDRDNPQLPEALRLQRTVLEEKRLLLDRAICAIVNAEEITSGKQAGAAAIKRIIEAMETQTEFMRNYYREEAWVHFKARHREWPSREWTELFRAIQPRLLRRPGERPRPIPRRARWKSGVSAIPAAIGIHGGLIKARSDRQYWPAAVQEQFSACSTSPGFQSSSPKLLALTGSGVSATSSGSGSRRIHGRGENAIHPGVGRSFASRSAEALDDDPAGETGQALAARWMEVVEGEPAVSTRHSPDFTSPISNGWTAGPRLFIRKSER